MKQCYRSVALLLGACLFVPAAAAQITPIEIEFTGDHHEPFAQQLSFPFVPCIEGGVFQNSATLCAFDWTSHAPSEFGLHLTQSVAGLDPQCALAAKVPPQMAYSRWGYVVYEFNDPITRFGGYFGTVNSGVLPSIGGATITFYDEASAVIASSPLQIFACGTWYWHGWESTVPVKKIRIESQDQGSGGGGVIMDDLRIASGPSPCYANCDGSAIEPILNVDDFTCFINEFAAAQSLPHEEQITHYANCDGSTIAPALTVDDFTCFINAFAAGCQ